MLALGLGGCGGAPVHKYSFQFADGERRIYFDDALALVALDSLREIAARDLACPARELVLEPLGVAAHARGCDRGAEYVRLESQARVEEAVSSVTGSNLPVLEAYTILHVSGAVSPPP